MKNKFKIIFLLLVCVILIGCNKKDNIVNEFDYVLELDSNPSTGYTWNYTIEDDSVISIEEGEYISSTTDENIVGAPGRQKFIVHGLKEGSTTVIFKYRQTWDEESTTDEITYSFYVDSENNVILEDTLSE